MNSDDLILVSVDDHIIEPPDMFEGRLPKKYVDRAPRVALRDDGATVWREVVDHDISIVARGNSRISATGGKRHW
jgi:hypothetical protein